MLFYVFHCYSFIHSVETWFKRGIESIQIINRCPQENMLVLDIQKKVGRWAFLRDENKKRKFVFTICNPVVWNFVSIASMIGKKTLSRREEKIMNNVIFKKSKTPKRTLPNLSRIGLFPIANTKYTSSIKTQRCLNCRTNQIVIMQLSLFLVACTQLYNPLCPSVGWLVGRSRFNFFMILFFDPTAPSQIV